MEHQADLNAVRACQMGDDIALNSIDGESLPLGLLASPHTRVCTAAWKNALYAETTACCAQFGSLAHIAAKKGHHHILELLKHKGADLRLQDQVRQWSLRQTT